MPLTSFDLTPFDLTSFDLTSLASGSAIAGSTASAVTPEPAPTSNLQQGIEPGEVSPGLLGFLPVFAIALVCIGLFLSLTSKLRKVNRKQAQIDAEEAAARQDGAGSRDGADGGLDEGVDGPVSR